MNSESVVKKLVATGTWSEQAAFLAERAGYKCEYCDLKFFESAVNYKQWQEDHLEPKSAKGGDHIDNLVASCRTCNVDFKARWNPREHTSPTATRAELILAVRAHIAERKKMVEAEIAEYREITEQ